MAIQTTLNLRTFPQLFWSFKICHPPKKSTTAKRYKRDVQRGLSGFSLKINQNESLSRRKNEDHQARLQSDDKDEDDGGGDCDCDDDNEGNDEKEERHKCAVIWGPPCLKHPCASLWSRDSQNIATDQTLSSFQFGEDNQLVRLCIHIFISTTEFFIGSF